MAITITETIFVIPSGNRIGDTVKGFVYVYHDTVNSLHYYSLPTNITVDVSSVQSCIERPVRVADIVRSTDCSAKQMILSDDTKDLFSSYKIKYFRFHIQRLVHVDGGFRTEFNPATGYYIDVKPADMSKFTTQLPRIIPSFIYIECITTYE